MEQDSISSSRRVNVTGAASLCSLTLAAAAALLGGTGCGADVREDTSVPEMTEQDYTENVSNLANILNEVYGSTTSTAAGNATSTSGTVTSSQAYIDAKVKEYTTQHANCHPRDALGFAYSQFLPEIKGAVTSTAVTAGAVVALETQHRVLGDTTNRPRKDAADSAFQNAYTLLVQNLAAARDIPQKKPVDSGSSVARPYDAGEDLRAIGEAYQHMTTGLAGHARTLFVQSQLAKWAIETHTGRDITKEQQQQAADAYARIHAIQMQTYQKK